jgi:hypothetical protein
MAGRAKRNACFALIIGGLVATVAGIWTTKGAWRASID